jgi:phosphatidate cytidylyltransferase
MLKHRLLFGILMTAFFTGLVLLDGWWDGAITASGEDNRPVQGTLLAILAAGVLGLATIELSRLAAARGLVVLNPAATVGVVLLSTAWYWPQLTGIPRELSLPLAAAVVLAAMLLQQHARFGTAGALANCGISCFSVLYLGLLGAFMLAIRIDAGLWPGLMFIFSVKASDIGAYAFGRMFGKHKFSPRVSPGKTWEGLGGAVAAAMLVSFAFAAISGIIRVGPALVFGGCMAVIGQLSDLAESMLKRDARQKDSSNRVPGFGGILDVVDSLLFTAPFAYLFFRLVA